MRQADIKTILQDHALFQLVPTVGMNKLVGASQLKKIHKDQLLFSKGDMADAAYIIVEGNIAIELISMDGRTVCLSRFGAGMLFGEMAVLDNSVRTADARAVVESTVLWMKAHAFQEVVTNTPALSMAIISDLIARLRSSNLQVEDLSFHSLRKRIALFLLSHFDDGDGGGREIIITQAELAELVGATREKVNVHLQAIQRQGFITVKRGKILILDGEGLETLCNENV